ncbi:MAG TPA: MarR family transcriptional regulator [Chitinophagales bacterium]|nr:MarR family transcriptional regulator [Chitinophagales bacterium]HRG36124.1 MarR family transcriptional regulator [Chitinophagales bacterium]
MDLFQEAADKMVLYHLRTSWLNIAKAFNDKASQYNGTISMAFILMALYEEEGVPVTKIAPRIGMEPNSLSRTLNTLEEAGYLARKQDENDQRKVLVFLTEDGKKLRKIALKTVFDLEKKIQDNLTPKQLKAFNEVIGQVSTAIEDFGKAVDGSEKKEK